jgi:hyaluronan synthase
MKHKLLLGTGIILLTAVCIYLTLNYALVFCGITLFYTLVTACVAYSYKPSRANHTPACDILVPAFNEGEHVYKTLRSLVHSHYSSEFRVIAIDDGSTDDTRKWMEKAQKEFPGIVTIFCDRNRGKKHALVEGIRASNSEIIVTVDSDSIVTPDSIADLLRPFRDPQVGAVAGNICVQNLRRNLLPRLMDIIFVFSYELLRSSQSCFGAVLCTPGALSAYRRTAVVPLLDEWLEQRFLGHKTTIGEDRALTCMLIKNKWKILYQETAKAYTNMPESYAGLCKMLLRWVRGDIRENILLAPYVFRNLSLFDIKSLGLAFHYIIFNIGILSPVVLSPILFSYLIFNFSYAGTMLLYMACATLLWSVLPTLIYARKKSLRYSFHAFTYSFFSLFFLMWIPLYALFTLDNNRWLTRK